MKIQIAKEEKILAALFAICSAFGVLPVSRHHYRSKPRHTGHSDCFKPNGRLMAVTYLQTIFVIFCAYYTHPSRSNNTSSNDVILWTTHFTSSSAVLLLSSQSASKLSVLLSEACKIHSQTRKRFKSISIIYFFFTVLLIFLPLVIVVILKLILPHQKSLNYFLYNHSYVPLAAVEALISCLCLISEQDHVDINSQIKGIKKKATVKNFFLLKDLIERHLNVQEFVGDIAWFFRLHFLNIFLTIKIRLTFYAISLVAQGAKLSYFGILIDVYQIALVIIRVFWLCFRCHRVQEQAHETAAIIRRIQVNWMEDLTDDQSELVIGLVITYSLVALQSGTFKSQ